MKDILLAANSRDGCSSAVEDSRSTWQPCVCGSLPLAASGRATRVGTGPAKRTIFGNECRARRRGGSRTVPLRRIRRSGAHFQGWFRGLIVPSGLSRVPAVYRSPGPIIAATSPSSPTIRMVPPFSLAKRCCVPTPEICCRSWGSGANVNLAESSCRRRAQTLAESAAPPHSSARYFAECAGALPRLA